MTLGVSDEESLLMQLCHHLHDSGFLFNDATSEEVERGQAVLEDFFEQEGNMVRAHLAEELLRKFVGYVQKHPWSHEDREQRLRRKMVKAFDQLAQGTSHSWNLARNIQLGLRQFQQHVLQDFLLYLTTYHQLILEEPEPPKSDKFYTINDLMRLREELVARVEGRKLVKLLLGDISRQRGGHMPLEGKNTPPPTKFVRPSQMSQKPPPSRSMAPPSPPPARPSTRKEAATLEEKGASAVNAVETFEEDFQEHLEELDFREEETHKEEEEANVVYGTGTIHQEATAQFTQQHTDSALKYLFRKDLTEKPLPLEMVKVHEQWEKRGLKRRAIRNYILEIMEWETLPKDQSVLELSNVLKDRIYDLLHGGTL